MLKKNPTIKTLAKQIFQDVPIAMKISLISLTCFLSIVLIGCSYYWQDYPSDNKLEQAVEAIIKEETGLDIDLSPNDEILP